MTERLPIIRRAADGKVTDGTARVTPHEDHFDIEDMRDLDGNELALKPGDSYELSFESDGHRVEATASLVRNPYAIPNPADRPIFTQAQRDSAVMRGALIGILAFAAMTILLEFLIGVWW